MVNNVKLHMVSQRNRIGGVIVVIPSHYKIGICCFLAKHAALGKKEQRLVGLELG